MNAIDRSTFCDYTYKLPVLQLSCKMFDRLVVHKVLCKKSLKIPKVQSESVYRRTDNAMAKRKSTKGQTTIYKTYIYN